jgi:hypothetical protein
LHGDVHTIQKKSKTTHHFITVHTIKGYCVAGGAEHICGPTQLNIHFKGVYDHEDEHDLVFSGLYTFLKRRVDSVDTV